MSEPRYVVETITGYGIHPGSYGSDMTQRTSFSVLDTAHNHREVYTEYSANGSPYKSRCKRAYAECARLNALEEQDEREHTRSAA